MALRGELGGDTYAGAYEGANVNTFDTGLHRAQRTRLRQAIVGRLAQALLKKESGRYIRCVFELPRPLRTASEDELAYIAEATQAQTPAVGVALGKKTYTSRSSDGPGDDEGDSESVHYEGEIEVALYLVSGQQRGVVEGQLAADVTGNNATDADPGLETMLEHVEELLLGQGLDIAGVHELRPESEDVFTVSGDVTNVTVWEQRYSVRVSREINPARAAAALATSIAVDHDVDGDFPNPIVTTITELDTP